MLPRFLAAIDAGAGTARLPEDEARHLSQVLRLHVGDEIAVFDGRGREFRARVEEIARDGASVRLGEGTAFADWIARDPSSLKLLLVEPSASVEGHPASTLQGERPPDACILIGPEGGWSASEVESAVAAGYLPITLGRRTLRADA